RPGPAARAGRSRRFRRLRRRDGMVRRLRVAPGTIGALMSIIHRLIPLVPSAMALALALASHAWAQPAQSVGVAHLQHVTGNVLVSKETGLASGSESTVLTRGARVITTANSEVTVV